MKILIPTDFSDLSKVAIDYAIQLALTFKAQLSILSVVYASGPGRGSLGSKDLLDVMINDAKKDGDLLLDELQLKNKILPKVECEVIAGYPVEKVVCNHANSYGADLIVMGTKGASGLKKIFLGSNAAAVIDRSILPVIAVPEFAKFNGVRDIVYATDITNLKSELDKVISFARTFNARVHILHVTSPREESAIDAKTFIDDLIKATNYSHISFAVSHADDPEEGIDAYITKNKIDLLAMFTHELSFFEKIFGQSITRSTVFHSHVPLLTFKK